MPIKFYNVRSKEVKICETEPMISAFWGSSDRSPNVSQGQDFGWRLHPATVLEVRRIQKDDATLQRIALKYSLPLDSVTETAILRYISEQENQNATGVEATEQDFSREYEDEIRRLEEAEAKAKAAKEAAKDGKKEENGSNSETSAKAGTTSKKG